MEKMKKVFLEVRPEIVIHMAAQPIVRESYRTPVYTYETNVMGTVNLLECVRLSDSVRSVINVTTDKVYKNREWYWGYRENEELNGHDPYSNSKSCSELVTSSYKECFLNEADIAVSTVRAGNVIGGGDFAADRIIPDCVRAVENGNNIVVRNPYSVRPYEHVLEPIAVYLMLASKQYKDLKYAGSYNVGPEEADCLTTGKLVDLFCKSWKAVIKSLCPPVCSEVLYMVAVHLNEILRRLSDFGGYFHNAANLRIYSDITTLKRQLKLNDGQFLRFKKIICVQKGQIVHMVDL